MLVVMKIVDRLKNPECIEISENSNNDNLFNNESNCLANDEDVDRDFDDESQNSEEIIADQIRDNAFKLINHFRFKNQLSSLLLNEIIKYFGDFINDLLYIIKDKTLNAFEFSEDERIFSISGHILSSKRSRMSVRLFSLLVFLKLNEQFI
jgi:hypothetical protein